MLSVKQNAYNFKVYYLTLVLLIIGFAAEAELLLQYSSAGGGKRFPARRCILFAAPVIC